MFQQETSGVHKEVIEGNMAKGLFVEAWARLSVPTRDVQESRNCIQGSSNRDRGGALTRTQKELQPRQRHCPKGMWLREGASDKTGALTPQRWGWSVGVGKVNILPTCSSHFVNSLP